MHSPLPQLHTASLHAVGSHAMPASTCATRRRALAPLKAVSVSRLLTRRWLLKAAECHVMDARKTYRATRCQSETDALATCARRRLGRTHQTSSRRLDGDPDAWWRLRGRQVARRQTDRTPTTRSRGRSRRRPRRRCPMTPASAMASHKAVHLQAAALPSRAGLRRRFRSSRVALWHPTPRAPQQRQARPLLAQGQQVVVARSHAYLHARRTQSASPSRHLTRPCVGASEATGPRHPPQAEVPRHPPRVRPPQARARDRIKSCAWPSRSESTACWRPTARSAIPRPSTARASPGSTSRPAHCQCQTRPSFPS